MPLSTNTGTGDEPPAKKPKLLLVDADRAEGFVINDQPGRVNLYKITWCPDNRGGQGILPLHAQDIANNITEDGTSRRRYGKVRLVEVPEHLRAEVLAANKKKAGMNPFLADFRAMSHTGPLYATLCCTHFVEAQKLIMEGGAKVPGPARRSSFNSEGRRQGGQTDSVGGGRCHRLLREAVG